MRRCPGCGARDARRSHRRGRERWLGWLPLRPYRCRACKRRYWSFTPMRGDGRLRPAALVLLLLLPAAAIVALYMQSLPYGREVPAALTESADGAVLGEAPPPEPASTGPTLEAIIPRPAGDRVTIDLAGAAPPFRSYFLARPARHVLELEGPWRLAAPEAVAVGHPRVDRVRAIPGEGALRVEILLGPEGRGEEPRVIEGPGGLLVVFGSPR